MNCPTSYLRLPLPQVDLQLSAQSETNRTWNTRTHCRASTSPKFNQAARCSQGPTVYL